jgi:hypothetical protein
MENYFNTLPILQTITFLLIGGLLYILTYLIKNYLTPLLEKKKYFNMRIIKKTLIITWVLYFILFLSSLILTNALLTLFISILTLVIGWSFFINLFSGIIIMYKNQPKSGDYIITQSFSGKVTRINFSETKVLDAQGDLISIPNKDLMQMRIKYQKNKEELILFSYQYSPKKNEDYQSVYLLATNCPFFTSNQIVQVKKTEKNTFKIIAYLIDDAFREKAILYFEN